jgi:hypothetical protein
MTKRETFIQAAEKEVAKWEEHYKNLPRLTSEDKEDISDNYCAHVEVGGELDCAREYLKALKDGSYPVDETPEVEEIMCDKCGQVPVQDQGAWCKTCSEMDEAGY